jgi:phospholipid/cholesterol/gamma-HCH transport system substrate-binding protein
MGKRIAVGIFFFCGMAILGYYTILVNKDMFANKEVYYISAVFADAEGLSKKDKVRVNGVLSGEVDEVMLSPSDSLVRVRMKLFNHFIMYDNYKVQIKNETMLVGKFVGIYPGSKYAGGRRMDVVYSYENLKGTGLADPIAMLTSLLENNSENLYATMKNIREITDKINTGKGSLGKLINENKVLDSTDDLIKELRETIEDTREQAPVTSFLRAALMAF